MSEGSGAGWTEQGEATDRSAVKWLIGLNVALWSLIGVLTWTTAARADGPDSERVPPNVIHVQEIHVSDIQTPSPWSLEVRGGGGSEGLVEAALMRAMDGPVSVGVTIGWVGQSGDSSSSSTTTTVLDCWHKLHCSGGSTTTTALASNSGGDGLILYQAEVQYRFGSWREFTPYFAFSMGGLSDAFGATGTLGVRMGSVGVSYRVLGSPDLPSALHAAVVTFRLR